MAFRFRTTHIGKKNSKKEGNAIGKHIRVPLPRHHQQRFPTGHGNKKELERVEKNADAAFFIAEESGRKTRFRRRGQGGGGANDKKPSNATDADNTRHSAGGGVLGSSQGQGGGGGGGTICPLCPSKAAGSVEE